MIVDLLANIYVLCLQIILLYCLEKGFVINRKILVQHAFKIYYCLVVWLSSALALILGEAWVLSNQSLIGQYWTSIDYSIGQLQLDRFGYPALPSIGQWDSFATLRTS